MVLFLELIRIILIMVIFGGIISSILAHVYIAIGIDSNHYGWISSIAILLLFFVLYRNKWQFSGWYKGKGKEKLSKIVSKAIIFIAIFLILLPPILIFLRRTR